MEPKLPEFNPVDHSLTLTKSAAAARQVLMAVQALEAGAYDAAITLAGAAEEMLPGDPEIEITTQLFNHPAASKTPEPYTWKEIVNIERNWLKQRTAVEKMPAEITLDLDNAPFYVFRALRKLPLSHVTVEMLAFEEWYRARIRRQIEQRKARG